MRQLTPGVQSALRTTTTGALLKYAWQGRVARAPQDDQVRVPSWVAGRCLQGQEVGPPACQRVEDTAPHHAGSVRLLGQRPRPPKERGSQVRQRSRRGRRDGLPRARRGLSLGSREAGKILSFLSFSCYYVALFLFLLSGGHGEKEIGEPCYSRVCAGLGRDLTKGGKMDLLLSARAAAGPLPWPPGPHVAG